MDTWACIKLTDTTIDPVKLVATNRIHNYAGEKIDPTKMYNVKYGGKWRECLISFISETYEEAVTKQKTQRVRVPPINSKLLSASEVTEEEVGTDTPPESDTSLQLRSGNLEEEMEEIFHKRKAALLQNNIKKEHNVPFEKEKNEKEENPSGPFVEAQRAFKDQGPLEEEENEKEESPWRRIVDASRAFEDPVLEESKEKTGGKRKSSEKKRKRELSHEESWKEEYMAEMKRMRREMEKKDKFMSDFRTEVVDLLKGLHGNWKQLKVTEPQNPNNILENFVLEPKSGFIKNDGNGMKIIHIGQDIWLDLKEYNQIVWSSSSKAIFVKNLAMKLFGEDTLKSHSVSGMAAPRTGEQRPPLDGTKCLAIRDAYRVYLEKFSGWTNEDEVIEELDNIGYYLQEKIVDLNRKPRLKSNKISTTSSKKMTGKDKNGRQIRKKLKKSRTKGRKIQEPGTTSSSDDEEEGEVIEEK